MKRGMTLVFPGGETICIADPEPPVPHIGEEFAFPDGSHRRIRNVVWNVNADATLAEVHVVLEEIA